MKRAVQYKDLLLTKQFTLEEALACRAIIMLQQVRHIPIFGNGCSYIKMRAQ